MGILNNEKDYDSLLKKNNINENNTLLDNFNINKTVISVAHRLSSIEDYDLIYFLDEGRVLESGKHKDLINLTGKYYDMWKSQKKKNLV